MSEKQTNPEEKVTPEVKYCEYCDGCGWYKGGPVLNSICNVCKGTGITPEKSEVRKLSELIVDNLKGGSYEYLRWPEMTDAVESKIIEYSKNESLKAVELARKEGEERIREMIGRFENLLDFTQGSQQPGAWMQAIEISKSYLPEKGDNNVKTK